MPSGIYAGGEYLSPWCNVSHVSHDKVVFYSPHRFSSCVPCLLEGRGMYRYELRDVDDRPFDRIPTIGWSYTNGKSVLVVVNPRSGTGKSAADALEEVVVILKEAGILLEEQHTQFRGHARDIVSSLPAVALRSYDAILSVGGDGTFREVVDGLVTACKTGDVPLEEAPAVAVIPSGSGNAVAASIGVTCAIRGALNVVHALRVGKKSSLCLLNYIGPSGRRSISIGGAQWGLIADCDMGTEHLRWMGNSRFTLGAIGCIARNKPVYGRLQLELHPMAHESAANQIAYLRGLHTGTRLPLSDSKRSESSIVLDGGFMTIVAWTSPYISMDMKFCPFARTTEEHVFDVVAVRAELSRAEIFDVMQSVKDGSFAIKSTGVDYFKVTKLTFEHLNGDFLTIDGESEPVEPFTLEIAPESGHIKILSALPFDPQRDLQPELLQQGFQ